VQNARLALPDGPPGWRPAADADWRRTSGASGIPAARFYPRLGHGLVRAFHCSPAAYPTG